ncbi:AAA family ATPase [Rariglobus hedericola]|uniref:AAA family ATPase n=1 Tax=Rariglobus hedericola TaxID=2597822 RepID=A0A556QP88_9BACT|nr:AAA family ATPase [Rariglobus hedericola]TSJ78460.1 AAA family ATPase [Rariglobus hedericola]
MRLRHVHISDYKNLKNFDLTFDGDSFLDVFVGKNGTGKSNLLEALIEIFRHLDGADDAQIDFDYDLAYEIKGEEIEITWENSILSVNGKEQKTLGSAPKPDNILVYYSGHNDTVSTLIEKYQTAFRKNLIKADASETRFFIGLGSDYKELLLTTVLLQPEASICRQYICRRLGIKGVAPDLKVTLKRPHYALKKTQFDFLTNEEGPQFWGAAGSAKDFLSVLYSCTSIQPEKGPIRTEGYQADDDKYIFYVNCQKLTDAFSGRDPHELFNALDKLKVLEMLDGLSVELLLVSGASAYTSHFSDGQFQTVYIYAITELFKTRHCITLLDEPDSFLHPEWQHEFLSQISEISDAAAKTNHTLLSSHSASTISSSNDSLISLFEIDGATVKISKVPKSQVITTLSAGLITFSEKEARLTIQLLLRGTTKPVLFTEGVSDEVILETAWGKLYPGETRPFEIQNAFCCGFLGGLLQRDDIYDNHPRKTFFGLFDFDDAYNEWNGCKGDSVETDPHKCLTKKLRDRNSYVLLLPVPTAGPIKDQVIHARSGEHFKANSRLAMELLFHQVPSLSGHFEIDPSRPGNVIRFVGEKVRFAKEVVPRLAPAHFKVFEPIFDFIRSKCPTPAADN